MSCDGLELHNPSWIFCSSANGGRLEIVHRNLPMTLIPPLVSNTLPIFTKRQLFKEYCAQRLKEILAHPFLIAIIDSGIIHKKEKWSMDASAQGVNGSMSEE